jgi:hypothetical protein
MKPDLEAAFANLEALVAQREGPTRHDARPILLGIGECLLSGRSSEATDAKSRLGALPPAFREAWDAAVRDELTMACTEHIRSVDTRYLDHPAYDFEYTLEARRLLEARLRAAEWLGCAPDEVLSAGVHRADSTLQLHWAKKNPLAAENPAKPPPGWKL